MDNTSQHWTEDSALLEQFVLGKIPDADAAHLGEHLASCAPCRERVEQEREFIKTVRAFGRESLRLRLKERIERSPSRVVPWPHVLSAAAIVLFIVGLGFYNRWWQESDIVQSEEEVAAQGGMAVSPAPKEAAKLDDAKITGKAESVPTPGAGQAPRSDLAMESQAGKTVKEGGKKEKEADKITDEEKEPSFAARPSQIAAADEVQTGKSRQVEYWLDGALLDKISTKEQMRAQYREKDSAGAPDRGEIGVQLLTAQKGNYLLLQLPVEALPSAQQHLQKGMASVPTKVNLTADGAILTIYTDVIDLQNKTVQGRVAGKDSLVFDVNGTRIAFKLPPAVMK